MKLPEPASLITSVTGSPGASSAQNSPIPPSNWNTSSCGSPGSRSSTILMVSPGTRYAVWPARWASASRLHWASRTNTCGSGQNRILVPVTFFATRRTFVRPFRCLKAAAGPGPANSPGTPRRKLAAHSCPSRSTFTSSRTASAFTTDAPTPCSPPEAV